MKWQIDPAHTSASVSARHMMLSTVRASLSGTSGELDFEPARPEAARIRLAIPAASVNTGDEKRDGHLRSPDFLDVDRFPYITFQSDGVRRDGDGYVVTGDLTIRGTTLPAEVRVVVNGVVDGMKGKVAGFSGTATIDRTKWGLVWNMPIPGGVLVSEKLKLEFDLQAVEAVAAQATAAA
jgi:polyisoprenoid-binding protein YceI